MERINFNSYKLIEYIENLNPQSSGLFFSTFLHLFILLLAIGIPNFFSSNNVYVPNIIPIEILNVTDSTNIEKAESKKDQNESKQIVAKQKKFNSSENTEFQKQIDLEENKKNISDVSEQPILEIKEKSTANIVEKEVVKIKQKELPELNKKIESLNTKKIKPKIKPKPKIKQENLNQSDVQSISKLETKQEPKNNDISIKPKTKPEEDFSIASMLKDLRNEKSNNVNEKEVIEEEDKTQLTNNDKNENMILSISEIDLLRQQLSSCWNAPAGAVIERGMKVTISAKIRQNMQVLANSIRIIDTNISKSNSFYGPITESAMRTLLNPECIPLKLPEKKYNLWKNLTITFDHSIMRGY